MTSSSSGPGHSFGYSFKILLIGDSGVGKSSLLISNHVGEHLSPTIGVDFKIKLLTVGDKKLKLTIWDTAGQERFRALTSSYYRGSQGIILVYDVTKRETFTNLVDVWVKEVELYSTNQNCVKVLVGNKIDKDAGREVTSEEGIAFANEYGCLFLECSAKTRYNVEKCFEELALKIKVGSRNMSRHNILEFELRILEVPKLVEEGSAPVKRNSLKPKQDQHARKESCCT